MVPHMRMLHAGRSFGAEMGASVAAWPFGPKPGLSIVARGGVVRLQQHVRPS